VILKYIICGIENTRMALEDQSENPNINEILQYIENVKDFKRCEDEIRAAYLLETNGYSLEHVPGHLLKSREVRCFNVVFFCAIIYMYMYICVCMYARARACVYKFIKM